MEVRRHTTTEVSRGSEIVPGAGRRTAGFVNVRGGVPTIHGTPVLARVESLVENVHPYDGRPLAVGTETFAAAADPGGPYVITPAKPTGPVYAYPYRPQLSA